MGIAVALSTRAGTPSTKGLLFVALFPSDSKTIQSECDVGDARFRSISVTHLHVIQPVLTLWCVFRVFFDFCMTGRSSITAVVLIFTTISSSFSPKKKQQKGRESTIFKMRGRATRYVFSPPHPDTCNTTHARAVPYRMCRMGIA